MSKAIARRIWMEPKAPLEKGKPKPTRILRELVKIERNEYGDILLHLDGGEFMQLTPRPSATGEGAPPLPKLEHVLGVHGTDLVIAVPASTCRPHGASRRDPLWIKPWLDPTTRMLLDASEKAQRIEDIVPEGFIKHVIPCHARYYTAAEMRARRRKPPSAGKKRERGRPSLAEKAQERKREKKIMAAVEEAKKLGVRDCYQVAAQNRGMPVEEVRIVADRLRQRDKRRLAPRNK